MDIQLKMEHITKRFPGVLANDDISIDIKKGEIHALLGENGAGKSTLMSILSGLYTPDMGSIILKGKQVTFSSPRAAMNAGIGMVHQHFMLFPSLTVYENCMVGYKRKGLFPNKKKELEYIQGCIERFGLDIDPLVKVKELSVGKRQQVELLKALVRKVDVLILDEPTAVLTTDECDSFFNTLRELARKGITIIFISHKLDEVKKLCDRVSVLRNGRMTGTFPVAEYSADQLIELMLGRRIIEYSISERKKQAETVLEVEHLSFSTKGRNARTWVDDISFVVKKGEILGIGGVDGNGQTELAACLMGMQTADKGKAYYYPENIDLLKIDTREIVNKGISFIPDDRQKTGLVMEMSLAENAVMRDYYKADYGKGFVFDNKAAKDKGEQLIKENSVKASGTNTPVKVLSGGNQQKFIVARELSRKPGLLIAMHLTRGVDAGAIEYIHRQLLDLREDGMSIILISTEFDELYKLSDRIYMMNRGRLIPELRTY